MPKDEKQWSPEFCEYMNFIANHRNYRGLPIKKKTDGSYAWIATAKSNVGQQRIEWACHKADELGIPKTPGFYAEVMRQIHPTGMKPCQICGRSMSIFYEYPGANLLKAIYREFSMEFSQTDHISYIWDELLKRNRVHTIKQFFINRFNLQETCINWSKEQILNECEHICRIEGKSLLSPGAMSNFPDRYDGFHTYNRCCRAVQDKGRHADNLKGYTKDRRAYEYWSDGNIHAANMFMGSQFFAGASADHIGPISLGFVHDPNYLQRMDSSANSSKRDRLSVADIEMVLDVYRRTDVYPMSWYSREIWEHIVANYKTHPDLVPTIYRDMLKQNMVNFMFLLGEIIERCGRLGEMCLIECFLEEKSEFFEYSYSFDSSGRIVEYSPRHFTGRNAEEMERYKRIAIDAVIDFNDKENRNTDPALTAHEISEISHICKEIKQLTSVNQIRSDIERLMLDIQIRTIAEKS